MPQCKSNMLRVKWYPDANVQQVIFACVQKVRQVREVKKILAMLDESTRDEVLERIKGADVAQISSSSCLAICLAARRVVDVWIIIGNVPEL